MQLSASSNTKISLKGTIFKMKNEIDKRLKPIMIINKLDTIEQLERLLTGNPKLVYLYRLL